jgi:hypothetical protein
MARKRPGGKAHAPGAGLAGQGNRVNGQLGNVGANILHR